MFPEPRKMEKPENQFPVQSLIMPLAPNKLSFVEPSQFSLKKGDSGLTQLMNEVLEEEGVGLGESIYKNSMDSARLLLMIREGWKGFF